MSLGMPSAAGCEKHNSVISLLYVSEEPITSPLSSIHLHIDIAEFTMFSSRFLFETIYQNEWKKNATNLNSSFPEKCCPYLQLQGALGLLHLK